MSFKLFIYYSAVCGAWAGFLGWSLGQILASDHETIESATLKLAMALGILVALGVGLVDAAWSLPPGDWAGKAVTAAVAGGVGCLGGLLGAEVGLVLVNFTHSEGMLQIIFAMMGWTIMGLAVGASVGAYDLLLRVARRQPLAGALRKVRHGIAGGALGGFVGSLLYVIVRAGLGIAFGREGLRAPSAIGFVALGLFIGLLTGLAQIILREAWVRVESGARVGQELMLSQDETTIGRSESCAIGLFGDANIEHVHARILLQDGRYTVVDAGSASGTLLNEQPVLQPAPLRSGDAIRVGDTVLRFGERPKRRGSPESVGAAVRTESDEPCRK
jgi:hypothetical protein